MGLCKQSELDKAVQKANAKKIKDGEAMSDEERRKLVSTEQSLAADAEPKIPSNIAGLEAFTLGENDEKEGVDIDENVDADSFFNLPSGDGDKDDD